MNFSRIARQLNEGESLDAAAKASENAAAGAEKQTSGTARSREKQKAQMATQQSVVKKSDVSYASEQARIEREMISSYSKQASDWRTELVEAAGPDEEGNHPYVDVMPFMNQKQNEAKRQMKDSAKMKAAQSMQAGAMQAGSAMTSEGALNPFQVHHDKEGKPYTSKGSKKDGERIARNTADNRKRGPMAQDPYKSRAGESD